MNRVLFRESEIQTGDRLAVDDRRSRHMVSVLKCAVGDSIRIGVIGGATGLGTVEEVAGTKVTLCARWDGNTPERPPVDLIIALPRPKVIKRLWAPLASLGVGSIFLVNAAKVERDYYDTQWIDGPHREALLLEGLEQSGATWLPAVRVVRRLKPFVEDEMDALFPGRRRFVAHPGAGVAVQALTLSAGESIVAAIGPEGGWTEYELALMKAQGFEPFTLGPRVLRSDVACIAALTSLAARRLLGSSNCARASTRPHEGEARSA